jgi:dihydroneopterin aldolase
MPTPRGHRTGLSPREALLFEAGIKLGGVFHQYLGIPVSPRTRRGLERAIEDAVSLQPYVAAVEVTVRPERGGPVGTGRFGYRYLTAEMLDVRVRLKDGAAEVVARLAHRPDLRYPLMRVERASPRGGADRVTRARRSGRTAGRSGRRTARSGG